MPSDLRLVLNSWNMLWICAIKAADVDLVGKKGQYTCSFAEDESGKDKGNRIQYDSHGRPQHKSRSVA